TYSTPPDSQPKDIKNAKQNAPHLIEEPRPLFFYEDDEQDKLDAIGTDLGKYVNEMEAAFVTGEKDFSEWDDYVETIEGMGLDDYMEIQEKALERYLEN